MIRRMVVGLAVAASLLGMGPAGTARAEDATQRPDLTGQWRLDPRHSDSLERPGGFQPRGARGGMGGPGGPGGPGGMGRPGGMGGGRGRPPGEEGGEGGSARPGARPVRLPVLLHITQTGGMVSFEDSTGAVLQEITTLGGAKDTLAHAPKAVVLSGQWKGQELVVQRTGPRGRKVTETIALQDKGELLVVRTRIESSGDFPAREFQRAYRRTAEQ